MEKTKKKWSFSEGIFSHNPVFAAGMSLAPAVIAANTFKGAAAYAAVFSSVTLMSLMICSFLPKKLPYALRIILYTFIAAAVYIPFYIFFDERLEYDLSKLGVFLPMIVSGEFITRGAELRFFRMEKGRMVLDVISHIIGFSLAIIFLGFVRELFSTGGIDGTLYGISFTVPLLNAPCGGFILIGLMGAFIRLFKKEGEG
ncbi:MAG: hypothetical protein J6K92_11240 [Oscillospiraceae bacterium]|nr:hypothetical protein [Oscillospiraceae bacterium]